MSDRPDRTGYRRFGREYLHWDASAENILTTVHSEKSGPRWKRAVEVLNLSGTERVLELGAGRCWASYLFAKMGLHVVAVDFIADDVVGLGAGTTLCRSTDTHFERVVADVSRMPFRDVSFDAVFCNAVLHHVLDLKETIREAHRVLREGGIFVATCEHKLGMLESDGGFRHEQTSVQYDVDEHSLGYREYLGAFKTAGFHTVITFDGKYEEDLIAGEFDHSSFKGRVAQLLLSLLGKKRLRRVIHCSTIKGLMIRVIGLDIMIVGRRINTGNIRKS